MAEHERRADELHALAESCQADQQRRWEAADRVQVEAYLAAHPSLAEDKDSRLALIHGEFSLQRRLGLDPQPDAYYARFPDLAAELRALFEAEGVLSPQAKGAGGPATVVQTAVLESSVKGGGGKDDGQATSDWSTDPGDATHRADTTPPGASSERPQDVRGQRLGKFELDEAVGQGAFGTVYKALDTRLGRFVAIKLPRRGDFHSPAERERFLREARAAAGLRHPNICLVHEAGEIDGQAYIAMEFIDGMTLRSWLGLHRPNAREAAALTAKIARAVHYAHQHGVVHRDIKPTNLMIDTGGEPMLMDFGLAKELGEAQITHTGDVVGTPAYMAPEQAAGRIEQIGPLTDVYALGVLLYELVAGRPPFEGRSGEILARVQSETPPPLRKRAPQAHRDVETICLKAMNKEPAARYASAGELADDLERFAAGEPILARRLPLAFRVWRHVARRPWVSLAAVAACLIVAVSLFLSVHSLRQRHVTALLGQLGAAIESDPRSPSQRAEFDAALAELARLAPDEAATLRDRMRQRLDAYLMSQIDQPSLTAEDESLLKEVLDRFQAYDASRAEELRRGLAARWQTVFDLAAPMTGHDRFFESALLQPDGNGATSLAGSGSILSRVPSEGDVQWEIVLDSSWENAADLSLLLDAEGAGLQGYCFMLRGWTPADVLQETKLAPAQRPSLGTIRQTKGQLILEILRDGLQLQYAQMPMAKLPAGPLRLAAVRIGDKVSWEVGQLPAVKFLDPVAIRGRHGVFGLRCPRGVCIKRLRALRQTASTNPSPLQRADALFAKKDYAAARLAYEECQRASTDAEARQEARYKEARCLAALGRGDEADELLTSLYIEEGRRWPALAACDLWLKCVRIDRLDDGEKYYQSLVSRYSAAEIAQMVPSESREEIVARYGQQAKGMNLYRPAQKVSDRVKLAVDLAAYFAGARGSGKGESVRPALVRASRAMGREKEALDLAAELMQGGFLHGVPVCEYSWLLRVAGRPTEALEVINQGLAEAPPIWPGWREQGWPNMMVEKARVLVALKRWDEAGRVLDEALHMVAAKDMIYDYTSLCAVRGYLLLRQGDEAGAQKAWKEGLLHDWIDPAFGLRCVNGLILASLTNELTEQQAGAFEDRLLCGVLGTSKTAKAESFVVRLALPAGFLAPILRDAFRTPRGRECARQIVLQEVPFAQCVRLPPLLILSMAVRKGAFADRPTDEQDALVWQLADDMYAGFVKGTFGKDQAQSLWFAWSGAAEWWKGAAPKLTEQLRGPIAYVLGQRYRHQFQGRLQDARMFFETAQRDAPPGSVLKKLADDALRELDAAKGERRGQPDR